MLADGPAWLGWALSTTALEPVVWGCNHRLSGGKQIRVWSCEGHAEGFQEAERMEGGGHLRWKEMRFRMANYDGGLPSHPDTRTRRAAGLNAERHLGARNSRVVFASRPRGFGQTVQHPFEVTETGPGSCHVTIGDAQDPAISAGFDLPLTPASGLRKALAGYVTAALTAQERSSANAAGTSDSGHRPMVGGHHPAHASAQLPLRRGKASGNSGCHRGWDRLQRPRLEGALAVVGHCQH